MSDTSRHAPLAMDPATFRALGHQLVDQVAGLLEAMPHGPVTRDESPSAVRSAFGLNGPLPETGTDPGPLLEETAKLLFEHSLFNGHPRFFGYITASPAPIGMLADFLAAAVNPNVGAWTLAPAATEIETQTVRWIAELIGFPSTGGGLLSSGGNMANVICFMAARAAHAGWDVRAQGIAGGAGRRLRVYASTETHTWLQKAADLAGLGTESIRWIPTDADLRMDAQALQRQLEADTASGDVPFVVVGTAGSVSTGAVDPLRDIAAICKAHRVWFHVDGAYGGFAAAAPDASGRPARTEPRGFGGRRSAQVALRSARSRLRARARSANSFALRSRTIRRTTTSSRRPRTMSTTARRTRADSARSRSGWRCARSALPGIAR